MKISDISDREVFSSLLFSQPNHFSIDYEINPYMESDTDIGDFRSNWIDVVRECRKTVDRLHTVDYDTYEEMSTETSRLPDIVFSANHGILTENGDSFIVSNMDTSQRQDEPGYFEKWATEYGYNIKRIPDSISFEGSGDAKWHPQKKLLWVGYGPRTDESAVKEIDKRVDAKVISLELISERFYHLDVCFTALSKTSAIVIPQGLSDKSYNRVKNIFDDVLHVPDEDINSMGGNCARMPNGDIIIDKDNNKTADLLKKEGFRVRMVDTSEFKKSGGSVDCLFLRTA